MTQRLSGFCRYGDLVRVLAVVVFILIGGFNLWGQIPTTLNTEAELPEYAFQFNNEPLSPEIVVLYEDLTGKKVIQDAGLQGATITLNTTGELTRSEAIEYLEKSLLLNGYAFIPSGETMVKLIAFNAGKVPGPEGPPIIYSIEQLPETDAVVTYAMQFQHISAEDALTVFSQIAPNHVYGISAPVPNSGTLVITENSATIRYLYALREQIDRPPSQIEHKSIQLYRADAEEVALNLNELLTAQNESSANTGGRAAARTIPQQVQQRGGGLSPAAVLQQAANGGNAAVAAAAQRQNLAAALPVAATTNTSAPVEPQIVPIIRTNRILVIARPVDVAYIEGLIKEFDAEAEVDTFLRRKLRYLPVADFLPIASDALSRGLETGVGGIGGVTSATGRTTAQAGNQQTGGLGGGQGGIGQGATGVAGLSAPVELGVPESLVVGRTLLIADGQANNLIVSGPPDHLRIVNELIDQLDARPPQVYLSTVVGAVALNDNLEYGLDILMTLRDFGPDARGAGVFRNRANSISPVEDLDIISDAFPIFNGLTLYGQFGDDLNVFVDLLAQKADFRVLSRPSVFAKNNTLAIIESGSEVPVPTTSLTTLSTGTVDPSVTSNIEFRPVVLRLEVVPLINSEDEITLQVSQRNDRVTGTTEVGGNTVPIIGTESIETEVTVPNKSTVVLGGLITKRDTNNQTGLPFIVHVPILKHLLGSTKVQEEREELMIFIQPHIIIGDEDLIDSNIDESRRTLIAEDVARFANPPPPVDPEGTQTKRPRGGTSYYDPDGTEVRRPTVEYMPPESDIRPLK
ncbi:MAG: secretin N-terminal domain-containing protein [Verrucomicrobiota bacterium]